MSPTYPVMLDLTGRRAVVAGGGRVALRRAAGLADTGPGGWPGRSAHPGLAGTGSGRKSVCEWVTVSPAYAVMLDLTGRQAVVAGGGQVALRRPAGLAGTGPSERLYVGGS